MLKKPDIALVIAGLTFGLIFLASVIKASITYYALTLVLNSGGVILPLIFVFLCFKYLSGERGWRMIGYGVALWAVAEFIWFVYRIFYFVEIPSFSLADIFWVAGYIPVAAGLYHLGRGIFPALWNRQTIILPLGFLFGIYVMLTYLTPLLVSTADIAVKFVGLFYPVADLILFLIAADALAAVRGGRLTIPWEVLALSFMLFAISDTLYAAQRFAGTYVAGEMKDILYYLAYMLAVFAASEMIRIKEIIRKKIKRK